MKTMEEFKPCLFIALTYFITHIMSFTTRYTTMSHDSYILKVNKQNEKRDFDNLWVVKFVYDYHCVQYIK